MSWQSLTIEATADLADTLSDALFELGAISASIEDLDAGTDKEHPIFAEPGEASDQVWRSNLVNGLFAADADMPAIVQTLQDNLPLGDARYVIEAVEEQDWVRLTQSQFDPIPISTRLWITPTWHTPPTDGAINIQLDPGLAFGTGSHPTTRLCLQWLDAHLQPGESVLDYGCGSGILAIAALKLGAGSAFGVDIDPQAVQASRDNASQNSVDAQFYLPDALPPMRADVVVANILANPLKVLAPLLAAHCRAGGRIVLSGILEPQAAEVIQVYSEWFTMQASIADEGWVCVHGSKR